MLNKLKLKDNKTEAVIISPGRKSRSLSFLFPDSVTVVSASIPLSDSVKNLGVTFDCHLTMETQVFNLVCSANFEFCRISSIRHLQSTDATKTLVSAFGLPCFDYFWQSSVSPKQTTEGAEEHCSPCPESF